MCQWVLQQNGQVVPRRTLRRLRAEELTITNQSEARKRAAFDADIKRLLGDSISKPPEVNVEPMDPHNTFEENEGDEEAFANILPEADAVDSTGKPINQQSVADLLINAEVLLP